MHKINHFTNKIFLEWIVTYFTDPTTTQKSKSYILDKSTILIAYKWKDFYLQLLNNLEDTSQDQRLLMDNSYQLIPYIGQDEFNKLLLDAMQKKEI